jgi:hypothetical protein
LSDVPESLELERIARGIEEEHRRLLAHLALEAHVGLDHEADAGFLEAPGEGLPLGHREDRAEVAHRHVVAVHGARLSMARFLRREVRDHLVAVEVEVHPALRAAAFGTPEEAAVEAARFGEVVDGEGEVEEGLRRHAGFSWKFRDRNPSLSPIRRPLRNTPRASCGCR